MDKTATAVFLSPISVAVFFYTGGYPSQTLSLLFPQRVEEEALVKNSSACKDYLIEAMKYHLLPLDQRLLIKNPRTKPRTPVSLPKVSPSPAWASAQDSPGKVASTPASVRSGFRLHLCL